MIIAVDLVFKPRGSYRCSGCRGEIIGTHVSLFGAAERGDRPYRIRLCVPCAQDSARYSAGKLARALTSAALL